METREQEISTARKSAYLIALVTLIMLAGSTALFDEFPLARLIRDLNTHILHVGHDKTAQIVGAAELGESFDSTLQR